MCVGIEGWQGGEVPGGRGGVVKVSRLIVKLGHSHDNTNSMCVLACTITFRESMVPPSC
jgi:hypothetical protein